MARLSGRASTGTTQSGCAVLGSGCGPRAIWPSIPPFGLLLFDPTIFNFPNMTIIFNLPKIISCPCPYVCRSKYPHQIQPNLSRLAKIGRGFLIDIPSMYSFRFPQNQSVKLEIKMTGEDCRHH
ncbi:hypothetical protein [Oryza sativa Japonica Group]|uniref:Uncharacterized protein n=2 Tax=Oryza sativa subsp. japonica TaxID=39947 RepID=Q7F8L9_ORYSJ|nr:hypothetical protein [Oryza sativa Japonica Group]BAA85204.1 hypothetical protein [Oryza sativa Japonica Group]